MLQLFPVIAPKLSLTPEGKRSDYGKTTALVLSLALAIAAGVPAWADGSETPIVRALVVDPRTTSTLYAASSCGGVSKSTDGGAHWHAANHGIAYDVVRALAIDPSDPDVLFAGTLRAFVYKSNDGAGGWYCLCPDFYADGISALAVNQGVLYVGTGPRFPAALGGTIFVSTSGRRPDISAGAGLTGTAVLAIAIQPGPIWPPTTMYAAMDSGPNEPGGLFKTTTQGTVWSPLNEGLPDAPVRALALDAGNPPALYAGTFGDGIFKSTSGGASWSATGDGGRYVLVLATDPMTSTTLYAGTTAGVFKSTDAGKNWQASNDGLTRTVVRAVAIDPKAPSQLYAGIDGGDVFKSTDSGRSWNATGLVGAAVCGDGQLSISCTAPEQCDDGNLTDGDGCDSNCTPTACGNGVVSAGEQCDDGNVVSCDGCSATCQAEVGFRCGDGIVSTLCSPEQCDDGNQVDGDGCDSNCTPTGCGNGIVTAGEECDDGNVVAGDGCDATCHREFCGDGIVQRNIGEQCDDGNSTACDGCSPSCQLEVGFRCGDGAVSTLCSPEQCDDGNQIDGDGCDSNCTPTGCGNGIVTAGEECDDGNPDWFDGCTNTCTICGNGVVTPPEQCDDGNTNDFDGCTSACTRCGDGIVTPPESCDDGNLVDGDGCDSNCILPGCGNGVREEGEDCDDGGRCIGGAKAGVYCTSSVQCDGGACTAFGGDGCAANCTRESDVEFPLMPGTYADWDLPPRSSGVLIRGDQLTIPVHLSGSLRLTVGRDRGDHLIPVVIKANAIHFPPDRITEHFFGCVRGIALRTCGGSAGETDSAPPLRDCTFNSDVCTGEAPCAYPYSAGNAAAGVIDCRGGLIDGVDLEVTHDVTTGTREITFSGSGGPGSARLSASFLTTWFWETDCYGDGPESEVGKDHMCCTDDDPPNPADSLSASVFVTGTATATIIGANGEPSSTIGPFSATGLPFDCRTLLASSSCTGPVGLVSASTQTGLPTLGDVVETSQLFTPLPCLGDCHNDGEVTVDELLTMVRIALGQGPIELCMPGDRNRDDQITVDEIVAASNIALSAGCSRSAGD